MIDNKSKGDVTSLTGSSEVMSICDTATQNCVRILDEITRAQPQFSQSVSNLQLDYVAAAKNTIQNIVSVQKMLANNMNFHIVTPQYTNEFGYRDRLSRYSDIVAF